MKKTITVLAITFMIAACSTIKVSKVDTANKIVSENFYILPKTAIVYDLPVTIIEYTKSDSFLKLTEDEKALCIKYLGLNKELYEKFSGSDTKCIKYKTGDLAISTKALPDYKKIYKFKSSKFMANQSISLTYDNDGILSEGEATNDNLALDAVFKVVNTVVDIVTSRGLVDTKTITNAKIKELMELANKLNDIESNNTSGVIMTTDIYNQIKESLKSKISDLFADAFYEEKRSVKPFKLVYCPETTPNETSINLFTFNKSSGSITINADIKAQCDVYFTGTYSFAAIAQKDGDSLYKCMLKLDEKDQQQKYFQPSGAKKTGLVYNVPQKVMVTTYKNTEMLNLQVIKMPQFGITAALSKRQSKIGFSFNPETGELKKISAESKSTLSDVVEKTGGVATKIATDKAPKTEKEKLQEEADILELKKKIKDFKAAGVDN